MNPFRYPLDIIQLKKCLLSADSRCNVWLGIVCSSYDALRLRFSGRASAQWCSRVPVWAACGANCIDQSVSLSGNVSMISVFVNSFEKSLFNSSTPPLSLLLWVEALLSVPLCPRWKISISKNLFVNKEFDHWSPVIGLIWSSHSNASKTIFKVFKFGQSNRFLNRFSMKKLF